MKQFLQQVGQALSGPAYAMSGTVGFSVALLPLLIGAKELGLFPDAWSLTREVVVGTLVVFAVWCCFARFREELTGTKPIERGVASAYNVTFAGILLVALVMPPMWDGLDWLLQTVSFGRVGIAMPAWPEETASWIKLAAVATLIGGIVVARLRCTGADRGLLTIYATFHAVFYACIFYPDAVSIVGLLVACFFISLSWGGPVGDNARAALRALLNLARREPRSAPTTVGVPQTGDDVTKL